jgi:hypothetical protein
MYHVQVADSSTFDDEPILTGDFTGDLPVGWETTAVLTNGTSYALDGGGAVVFKGANKFLRTPMVANPATLTWYHATTSTNEWSYELQASPTTDFSTPIPIRSVTVTQKLATAVAMTANLRGKRNVYLRWVDTRPSGTAQRFISGISLTGTLLVNENGVFGTSKTVTGCVVGTPYYVRVRAWGQAGWSPWSAVKAVTTTGGGSGEIDPDNPPYNPDLELDTWTRGLRATVAGGSVSLDWDPATGAKGYNIESTTNLLDPDSWHRIGWQTNAAPAEVDAPDDAQPLFYRIRVW